MSKLTWTPVTVRLGQIRPWNNNPRLSTKAQAERLIQSERELGQVQTIAIGPADEQGFFPLYDGHQRYAAWYTVKGADFDMTALQSNRPLTEDERRKMSILLHTATGGWSWDTLSRWQVGELKEWGLISQDNIKGWQTDVNNVKEALNAEQETADAEPQIDRAAELLEKWGVHTGDLWQIGEHRLICGDCTDAAVVARVMDGERANLLMTSPPYWVGKDYETQENETAIDNFIALFIEASLEAMSDDYSRIVVNTGTAMATKLKEAETRVILLLDKYINGYFDSGWKLRHIRHWVKGGGRNRPGRPIDDQVYFGTEYFMTFYKSKSKSRGQNRLDEPWVQQSNWDDIQGDKQENEAGYPLEVPRRFIVLYTLEGEIVFDPFTGNGTTLVACQNLGRKGRAIEISPAYCAVTLQRMQDAFPELEIKRI